MVCIINPLTNRAIKSDSKLGKRLLKLADDIESEIKANKVIKTAAKRALKQKEYKAVLAVPAVPAVSRNDDAKKYKYLEVLDDNELAFALMHYYRKNYKGDNTWTSFLAKTRKSLMETIKKNNIKLSVKKPLDVQPKGAELNPDEIKKQEFKKRMMEVYKKK